MNEIIKIIANYFITIPIVILGVLFLRSSGQKRVELLRFVLIGGILTLALAKLGSSVYNDPRPFVTGHIQPLIAHTNDNGFPSDHTLLSAFIGLVIVKYSKWLGVTLLVIAGLIGTARVLAHVHHVTDIVGSFSFAAVGVCLAYIIVSRVFSKNQR